MFKKLDFINYNTKLTTLKQKIIIQLLMTSEGELRKIKLSLLGRIALLKMRCHVTWLLGVFILRLPLLEKVVIYLSFSEYCL